MSPNLTNTETEDMQGKELLITKDILELIIKECLDTYDIRKHFTSCNNLWQVYDMQRAAHINYFFKECEKPIQFDLEIDVDCCEGIEEPIKHARIWVEGYEMAKVEFSEVECSVLEYSETFLSELINHAL